MNLVKGDKVIVIAGHDKGKTGVIQKVIPEQNRVVVENVNVRKKHRKPTQANPEGSIIEVYAPIDASNVMLEDPKTKKPTRVGHKIVKGKKVRFAKKSGQTL
ncbi:MAG: 50S ribosomal protein L24 [Erysipelotrichaceae bacterium]|jgi:large subunit ribosomal protein L24|nr:50S ribosomal protein L24 [Bacilli bacterium]NLV28691.1 50S ribosomal protein L24 [Erysipelotrichaceae bacterium]HPY79664.1 50S ribosomal protein L24 [Bacilli bacterium]HQA55696.1 50S ribosomal protein L24 [Bacilli bacterium]